MRLNRIVHPQMKILSLFAHPQVVPNLNGFLSSDEQKSRYFEECWYQTVAGSQYFFP